MSERTPIARPAWTQLLTLEVLAGAFPSDLVHMAFARGYDYLRGPSLVDPATLTASLFDPTPAAATHRTSSFFDLRVTFRDDDGTTRMYASCTCNTPKGRCPHVPAMLVDLSVHPKLLDAVLARAPVSAFVAELPALREAVHTRMQAVQISRTWFELPPPTTTQPLEIRLVVVDGRPSATETGEYTYPTLELRLVDTATRTLIEPRDVLTRSIPRFERRIFTLGRPLARGRKGVALSGTEASLVLHLLRDAGRTALWGESGREVIHFGDVPVHIKVARTRLPREALALRLSTRESNTERVPALEGMWVLDDAHEVSARDTVLFSGPFPFVCVPSQRRFYPVDASVDLDVAWNLHCRPAVELSLEHVAVVYEGLQKSLSGRRVTLPPPEQMGLPPRAQASFTLRIEGSALNLTARLEARYEFGVVLLGPRGTATALAFEHDVRRDLDAESSAVARVVDAGLLWSDDAEAYVATQHDAAVFWSKGAHTLRNEGTPMVTVLTSPGLQRVRVRPAVKARAHVTMSEGLLDATMTFEAGDDAIDMEAVREALRNKRRWIELDDGTITEVHEALGPVFDELDELAAKKSSRKGEVRLEMGAHQLGRVDRWIEVGIEREVDATVETFRARLRALAVAAEPARVAGLRATLRPYQLQGLAWLQFLDGLGTGGVLADDMGLGKTLTTLALLLWRKERDGAAPSLVVCPTSVAGNWVREAARFTPSLKVLLYHGHAREKQTDALAMADVVVTTYALLRRDTATLAQLALRYVVLDEAQHIKNAGAQITRAARDVKAERRLALSGTPVENHLGELWSIMDFCNPGMLGSAQSFASRYERAIASEPTGHAAERLRALVRPFLLRRTKEDVLHDLPSKEEIDYVCAPSAEQRHRYDVLAATALADITRRIGEVGLGRSGLSILTALLRLRQMACDPRLIDASAPAASSAKREAFLELVKTLVGEGRRVLVFSQFVELLTLWRADLDALHIDYEYLDGSTRDRDAVVERFQTGSKPVFLISLKAGGTGLTLTAADTVIHCDPWWNPAVEDQATDRAHRMGQTRPVTVYRLVTKGTVEERIVALKARKRALSDAVITGDAGALRGLTTDDVTALFGASDESDDFEEPSL